jgi:hypothetical protein
MMVGAETVTLALAIIGSAGTVVQVYTTVRDRPRLRLDATTTTAIEHPPVLTVSVFSVGNCPTTVRKIGLHSHTSKVVIESQTEGKLYGEAKLGREVTEGVFLEAGQSHNFEWSLG